MLRRQSPFHSRAIHIPEKIFSVGVNVTSVDIVIDVGVPVDQMFLFNAMVSRWYIEWRRPPFLAACFDT